MLNDIHSPPLEPEFEPGKPGKRSTTPRQVVRGEVRLAADRRPAATNGRHLSDQHDRPHKLDRSIGRHTEGVDLVYPEPEDRGNSFNTTMSAIVVAVVVLAIALTIGLSIFWQ